MHAYDFRYSFIRSDQIYQKSQVSKIALRISSLNVSVFVILFVFVLVIVFWLVRSCLLITLINRLKGHKSLGSICRVVKTLIVSGARRTKGPSKGQGHILSCSGQDFLLSFVGQLVKCPD